MLADSKTALPAFFGLVSAVIGGVVRLVQLIGERSGYAEKKNQLQLLKMKCEIEGLRRKYKLEIPPILAAHDLDELRISELPWLSPERVRRTFWFRIAHSWSPLLVLVLFGLISILALGCVAGAVGTLYTIVEEDPSGPAFTILSVILLGDLVLAPTLVLSSIRIFIAFKYRDQA